MKMFLNENMAVMDTLDNLLEEYCRLKRQQNLSFWFGYDAEHYPEAVEDVMRVLEPFEVGT